MVITMVYDGQRWATVGDRPCIWGNVDSVVIRGGHRGLLC